MCFSCPLGTSQFLLLAQKKYGERFAQEVLILRRPGMAESSERVFNNTCLQLPRVHALRCIRISYTSLAQCSALYSAQTVLAMISIFPAQLSSANGIEEPTKQQRIRMLSINHFYCFKGFSTPLRRSRVPQLKKEVRPWVSSQTGRAVATRKR